MFAAGDPQMRWANGVSRMPVQIRGLLLERGIPDRQGHMIFGKDSYFVTIRLVVGGGGAAGVIAIVSHAFQPSGRCSAPNSL